MIRHVARREALEHARSPRFLVLCALALALMPLTAFVAARGFAARAGWAASLQTTLDVARAQRAPVGDEMATRFGWRATSTQSDPALRAIRQPSPGSVIASGLDDALPTYWQFGTEGVGDGPAAERGSEDALADLTLVVELVLGLLALLLTYDTISGERESGLLRAVLAHPVSRIDVLLGKFVGAAVGLAVPLVLGTGMSALVLLLMRFPITAADVWPRLVMFVALAAAYLGVLLALGLLVSAVCRQSRTSLFVALVAWVASVFLVPHAASAVAAAVRPVRPPEIARLDRLEGIRALERARGRALGDVWRATSGSLLPPADGLVAPDLRRRYDDARAPLERDFTRRKRDLLRDARTATARARDAQERVAAAIGALSPTRTFRVAAAAAAGTGTPYRAAWEDAVTRHQRALEVATFDRVLGVEVFPPAFGYLRVIIWPNPADPRDRVPEYDELPRFDAIAPDLRADAAAALPGLATLVGETVVLLILACGAFLWIDVV